jgi:hypothetical protein
MPHEDRSPIGVYFFPLLLIGAGFWAGIAWGFWSLFH